MGDFRVDLQLILRVMILILSGFRLDRRVYFVIFVLFSSVEAAYISFKEEDCGQVLRAFRSLRRAWFKGAYSAR